MFSIKLFKKSLLILTSFLFLAACGGDSDSSSDDNEPLPELTDISFDVTASGINSDITLLLNEESLLTTNTNAPITGTGSLAVDEAYEITYSSSANQLCNIENSTGVILEGTTNINVSLTCLNWVDPLSANDRLSISSEDTSNMDLAVSDNGDSVVVWQQSNGSDTQIFMSEFRNGTLTNPSSLLDSISPNGTDAHSPSVSINATGETVITWVQNDGLLVGGSDQIFISEYRNGTWTHPTDELDNISINGQPTSNPNVSINDAGDTILAWSQADGSREQIFISEYRNGVWNHPADLNSFISPPGGDGSSERPRTAINTNGDTIVTWRQRDSGSDQQVFISEFRNGVWSHPVDIDDNISPNNTDATPPLVSLNDSGETLITWIQNDGIGDDNVYLSEYRNNTWAHPLGLNDHISPSGADSSDPKLAISNNGEAVIVWTQLSSNFQIFMSEYRNGVWIHPTDLQDNISVDGSNARNPDVSINSRGESFITWQQLEVLREQIYRSEYRNGVWTHPQTRSETISLSSQPAADPVVRCNDSGEAVIIWEQPVSGGGSLQVYQSTHR